MVSLGVGLFFLKLLPREEAQILSDVWSAPLFPSSFAPVVCIFSHSHSFCWFIIEICHAPSWSGCNSLSFSAWLVHCWWLIVLLFSQLKFQEKWMVGPAPLSQEVFFFFFQQINWCPCGCIESQSEDSLHNWTAQGNCLCRWWGEPFLQHSRHQDWPFYQMSG